MSWRRKSCRHNKRQPRKAFLLRDLIYSNRAKKVLRGLHLIWKELAVLPLSLPYSNTHKLSCSSMLEVCNSLADVVVVDNALFGAEKRRTTCSLLWQAVSQTESTVMLGGCLARKCSFFSRQMGLGLRWSGCATPKKEYCCWCKGSTFELSVDSTLYLRHRVNRSRRTVGKL